MFLPTYFPPQPASQLPALIVPVTPDRLREAASVSDDLGLSLPHALKLVLDMERCSVSVEA